MASGSPARFVQKPCAGCFELIENRRKTVDPQSDMMQARAALRNELLNCRAVRRRFQEFDSRGSRKHRDGYALLRYVLPADHVHAEQLLIKAETFVDIANRYSKVVDFNGHFVRS